MFTPKYISIYFQGGQFRKDHVRMDGKVAVVTGCNTGIGKETVRDLARRGARVYMACRDVQAGHVALEEIVAETGNRQVFCRHLDLASLQSVRDFASR